MLLDLKKKKIMHYPVCLRGGIAGLVFSLRVVVMVPIKTVLGYLVLQLVHCAILVLQLALQELNLPAQFRHLEARTSVEVNGVQRFQVGLRLATQTVVEPILHTLRVEWVERFVLRMHIQFM